MSGRFSNLGGSFKVSNPLKNPFTGAKSALSYRQRAYPFFLNLIFGSAGLAIVVVAMTLMLVSIIDGGFQMKNFGLGQPKDSVTYGGAILAAPLVASCVLAIIAAFVGRALLIDSVLQWAYFLAITACNLIGGSGAVIVIVLMSGRLHHCTNDSAADPFCKAEEGDLIAGIVLIVSLLVSAFAVWFVALFGLFHLKLRLMAMGMEKKNRDKISSDMSADEIYNAVARWSNEKNRKEMDPSVKKGENAGLLDTSSAASGNGSFTGAPVSQTHLRMAQARSAFSK